MEHEPSSPNPVTVEAGRALGRRKLSSRGPIIAFGALLVFAVSFTIWQYRNVALRAGRETVSIGLTNDELTSLRKLIKPSTPSSRRGTLININQIRDLEERLTALEKAVPLGDSLSAAANNDLRLVQRDITSVRDQIVFQGQLVKDERAALWDQMKVWMGLMATLNLAILAFFWQITRAGLRRLARMTQ